MSSSLSFLDISALAAINAANLNFTPSTLARRGSQESISSSLVATDEDFSSHHHNLFRSVNLHNLREHWREQVWAHTPHRHERIALGHAPAASRVLGWEEMKEEIGRLPGLRKFGWAGVLPVAGHADMSDDGMGSWMGWRVKGATW